MIYSQTSPHNGPVHVSIRADEDASTLTFLDTLWSAALSLAPSSLFSNLRHSPTCRPSATHTPNSATTGLLLLFPHQRFPADSLSVNPTLVQWEARQMCNITTQDTELLTPDSKLDSSPISGCCCGWTNTGRCFYFISYSFCPQCSGWV